MQTRVRLRVVQKTDARVKLTGEVLAGGAQDVCCCTRQFTQPLLVTLAHCCLIIVHQRMLQEYAAAIIVPSFKQSVFISHSASVCITADMLFSVHVYCSPCATMQCSACLTRQLYTDSINSLHSYKGLHCKLCKWMLAGIKAIKLYAWEQSFKERILSLRHLELSQIRKEAYIEVVQSTLFGATPILIAMAAFAVYTAQGYALTPAVAFPALALFNLLRFPIIMLPWYLTEFINGWVALGRMQTFMQVRKVLCKFELVGIQNAASCMQRQQKGAMDEKTLQVAPMALSLHLFSEQSELSGLYMYGSVYVWHKHAVLC